VVKAAAHFPLRTPLHDVGDLVLIFDDDLAPATWLARTIAASRPGSEKSSGEFCVQMCPRMKGSRRSGFREPLEVRDLHKFRKKTW
jgi:hypothetical protein